MKTIGFNIRVLGTEEQVSKVGEIEAALKRISEARAQVNKSVKDAKAALISYNEDLKREKALYDAGAISEKEYAETKRKLRALSQQARETISQEAQQLGNLRTSTVELNRQKSELLRTINRENQINKLAKGSYDELNARLGALRRTYKELTTEQRNSADGKQLLSTIEKLDQKLKKMDASMGLYQRNVGNYSGALKELERRLAILIAAEQRQISQGTAASENHRKLTAEIQRTRDGIEQLKIENLSYQKAIEKTENQNNVLIDSFKGLGAIVGISFGMNQLSNGLKVLEDFDESVADAQKTTGLLRGDVRGLAQDLEKINTRTSLNDLLGIAESGGRLRVPKEELAEFVEQVDKFYVSLKDDLPGSVKDITTEVAKMVKVFKLDEVYGSTAEGINRLGSSINFLSANTKAQAGYILESTQKWAGFADMANVGAGNALGLAATLDELGIKVDVGTTAVQKFFTELAASPTQFRKVAEAAGITRKEFDNLYKNNPNELFLKILEGAKSSKTGLNALNETIANLGITESREIQTITALTNATDKLRQNQAFANEEMERGTSIADEFAIKNETLGATADKIKNFFVDAFVNSKVIDWMRSLFKSVENNIDSYGRFVTVLGYGLGIFLLWRAAVITGTAVMATYRIATIALATAKAFLTGNTLRATAGVRLFNITLTQNPIGITVTALLLLGAAFVAFGGKANDAAEKQKNFNDELARIKDEARKSTEETKSNITSLINVIKDETLTIETRKKAYADLVKVNKVFNGYLVDEKFNINGLLEVYGQYIKMLDQVAYAQAFKTLNDENIKKEIRARQMLFDEEVKLANLKEVLRKAEEKTNKDNSLIKQGNLTLEGDVNLQKKRVEEAKKNLNEVKKLAGNVNDFRLDEIRKLENGIKAGEKNLLDLEKKYGKDIAEKRTDFKKLSLQLQADRAALDAILGKSVDNSGEVVADPSDDKASEKAAEAAERARKRAEDAEKKRLEQIRKNAEYIQKLQNEILEQEINNEEEGIAKKIALVQLGAKREIEEVERGKIEKAKLTAQEIELNDLSDKLIEEKRKGHFKRIEDVLDQSTLKQLEKYKKELEEKVALTEEEGDILVAVNKEIQEKIDEARKDTYAVKLAEIIKAEGIEVDIANKTIQIEKDKQKAIMAIKLQSYQDQYNLLLNEVKKADNLDAESVEKLKELYAKIKALREQMNDSGSGASFLGDLFSISDSEAELLLEKADELMGQLFDTLSNAKQARIDADLKKQVRALEAEQKAELKSLDAKKKANLISDEQYERSKQDIEDKYEKKKEEAERRAFERKKKLDKTMALMAGAMAIMRILADVPKGDFGVSTAILIAAAAVTTGIQVANIDAQKFERGGMLKGPSHDGGGIPARTPDGNFIEMEGDEAVINKRSMQSNDVLRLTGTPKQIASAINSHNGYGDSFEPGATRVAKYGAIIPTASPRSSSIKIVGNDDNAVMDEFAEKIVDGINDKKVILSEKEVTDAQKTTNIINKNSTWG